MFQNNNYISEHKRQLLIEFRNNRPLISQGAVYFELFNQLAELILINTDNNNSLFGNFKPEHLGLLYRNINKYISENSIPSIGSQEFNNFFSYLSQQIIDNINQEIVIIEISYNQFYINNQINDSLIHSYFLDAYVIQLFPYYITNLSTSFIWHITANILILYLPSEAQIQTIFTEEYQLFKFVNWVKIHTIGEENCAQFFIRGRDRYTLNPIAEGILNNFIARFIDYWIYDIDEVFDFPFLV